ncbi:hypothetical protein BU15DRAFT_62649 [Melanogaster broomeanus]|nr:hypothetical protein BU15DRAFT_62649 [Melanogaster broomeanus]
MSNPDSGSRSPRLRLMDQLKKSFGEQVSGARTARLVTYRAVNTFRYTTYPIERNTLVWVGLGGFEDEQPTGGELPDISLLFSPELRWRTESNGRALDITQGGPTGPVSENNAGVALAALATAITVPEGPRPHPGSGTNLVTHFWKYPRHGKVASCYLLQLGRMPRLVLKMMSGSNSLDQTRPLSDTTTFHGPGVTVKSLSLLSHLVLHSGSDKA